MKISVVSVEGRPQEFARVPGLVRLLMQHAVGQVPARRAGQMAGRPGMARRPVRVGGVAAIRRGGQGGGGLGVGAGRRGLGWGAGTQMGHVGRRAWVAAGGVPARRGGPRGGAALAGQQRRGGW